MPSARHTAAPDFVTDLFHCLKGEWKLERRLQSSNAAEPSGRCHGIATLTPRKPSLVNGKSETLSPAVAEMLYHEQGQFQLQASLPGLAMRYMNFSRKYVWRLEVWDEGPDPSIISIWFTKPGTDTLDYFFHNVTKDMETVYKEDDDEDGDVEVLIRGHGNHLCVDDQYETEYAFKLVGEDKSSGPGAFALEKWRTTHIVKGPKKDQKIETIFTRKDEG